MEEDFGPMMSADPSSADESAQMRAEMELLRKEKEVMETEFGQKRGKFMELFRQKEEELKEAKAKIDEEMKKNVEMQTQIDKLTADFGDAKTQVTISELAKEDELSENRRKCQEEIASLQHIMKEAITQAHQEASAQLESERTQWTKRSEQMEAELNELRAKLSEKEGFLGSVAKTLQKKVSTTLGASEAENLEESMKKAQEDAEILKSVVMPLEEEIRLLKTKLRDTTDRNDVLEEKMKSYLGPEADNISIASQSEAEDKVKELNHHLETEKASRTDLEMYVAVLNTQKGVLQEDSDKLRDELQEICQLLEVEKREHNDLKRTWQMANDQFLESQRLMMMDMRRMEGLLSTEQSRQLEELKKKDAEREAQEKRVQELDAQRKAQEEKINKEAQPRINSPKEFSENLLGQKASSHTSLISNTSEEIRLDDSHDSLTMRRSVSGSHLSSSAGAGDLDASMSEIRLSPEKQISVPSLTQEMQRAITDPTPESEASQSLLASAKARVETSISMVGRRLVSEKEWRALQEEVKASREKLGRSCDMCSNYESQIQQVQNEQKSAVSQLRSVERHLEAERQAAANHHAYTEELEKKLEGAASEAAKEISTLVTKVEESEKYILALTQQFTQIQNELQQQLKTLTEGREELSKELTKLQDENDSLIGKYTAHSQQMAEESIDLPNTVEELHLLLLRYREEIITAKVAKEHVEGTLKSQILFLKDQVHAEQQEKQTMEETLSNEISDLQEKLALLQSAKSEMERQTTMRKETDTKLAEAENSLKDVQAKSKQLINALQTQLEKQANARTKLEEDVNRLKAKVSSLQMDLDNSEAVQRDFVKLSQSLQIQLEKIRSAENEVRWQHEEDVEDCSNCKGGFTVTKRKHHCRHCGKIFCADCLTKSVNSGPNLRPSKVCDVCHTILVQDATPYFSTEPPTTPD